MIYLVEVNDFMLLLYYKLKKGKVSDRKILMSIVFSIIVSIINSKDIFNPAVKEANLNLDIFSTFIASAGYVFMGKNSSL